MISTLRLRTLFPLKSVRSLVTKADAKAKYDVIVVGKDREADLRLTSYCSTKDIHPTLLLTKSFHIKFIKKRFRS